MLAVCMIIKGTADEAPLLDNCLKSISGHVDKIFLDLNAPKGKKVSPKILAVAKKYKTDYKEVEWTGNFVQARTDNFARAKDADWIMWLDADDTVTNPEKIKDVIAVAGKDVDGIYINYEYAHDNHGNITVEHDVARLIQNNGTHEWKSSFSDSEVTVHETLNPRRRVHSAKNEEFWVVHHSTNERMDASLQRNIKLLEQMFERSKDNPDPRILFYLATHYWDDHQFSKAFALLEHYLKLSGWAEERAQAWVYMGDFYHMRNEKDKARGCYMRALAENPDDATAYIELAELEMKDMLWQKAVSWLLMAVAKKPPTSGTIRKPMEATYRAYKLLAECYTNFGSKEYKEASKWLKKAIILRPHEPELQSAREQLEELTKVRDMNEKAMRLVHELKQAKEYEKIVPFIDNLPLSMQDSPLIHSVRNYYAEAKKWPKKSVAIICGSSALGAWGPWSLAEGIGGSEEAVIQLSTELTKLGWEVTVYATPGEKAGKHEGVEWRHYWEFNGKDTFDVLVGWRDPSFFDKAYKARKRYLWLHDVVDREEITQERLDNLEAVIFVSEYHRTLFPMVPDNKAFASGNGIDPTQFNDKVERDQYKVLYMSAHERGQEVLQKVWADVVKEVPQAHAHCYYGWAGYDHINRNNPERMQWKERLLQDMKNLPNFTDHGKIGHKDIAEEIQSSGVWAYPTGFPEVYCITGVKAQAGGAWPITTDFAVLPETVPFGDKMHIDELDSESHTGKWTEEKIEEFKQLLIKRLKTPPAEEERKEMSDWAMANMSWANTAKKWNARFNK